MPTDFDLKERYNIVVRSDKELAIYDSKLDRSAPFGYTTDNPIAEENMQIILTLLRSGYYNPNDFYWTDHREEKV